RRPLPLADSAFISQIQEMCCVRLGSATCAPGSVAAHHMAASFQVAGVVPTCRFLSPAPPGRLTLWIPFHSAATGLPRTDTAAHESARLWLTGRRSELFPSP